MLPTKNMLFSRLLLHFLQINNLTSQAKTIHLEWGNSLPSELRDQGPPQLILASDLVYTPATVQPLLVTLDQLVTGPSDTLVLMASEMREGAGLEQFHKGLAKLGFHEQLVRSEWALFWGPGNLVGPLTLFIYMEHLA
jgi:hypothetical protein